MAVQTEPSVAPALSFPREIFATLQPRQYLHAHLSPPSKSQTPIRPNGRKPSEWRTPTVNVNSLTHCHGSAVVRCGDTAVVCGVRGEILLASDVPNPPSVPPTKLQEEEDDDVEEIANLGLLVPNIELNTGSAPQNIPGAAPSSLAQSLTDRLLSLLHITKFVRAKDLRILYRPEKVDETDMEEDPEVEIKAYWTLYLDFLFISVDGSVFDAAWFALLAALRSTVLPRASWNPDMEMILCSDDATEAKKLDLVGLPIPASFGVFEHVMEGAGQAKQAYLLAEPDSFEEELCNESITVTVDKTGGTTTIRRLEKKGGAAIGRDLMKEVVASAEERWIISQAILNQSSG